MTLLKTIPILAILMAGVSFADHTVPDHVLHGLSHDSRQLESAVRYSTLRWQVKQSVFQFSYAVQRFMRCINYHFRGNVAGHRDHTIPGNCEYAMREVRQTWYPVDRYLWDTYYDYPYVYQAYLKVREDVRQLPY